MLAAMLDAINSNRLRSWRSTAGCPRGTVPGPVARLGIVPGLWQGMHPVATGRLPASLDSPAVAWRIGNTSQRCRTAEQPATELAHVVVAAAAAIVVVVAAVAVVAAAVVIVAGVTAAAVDTAAAVPVGSAGAASAPGAAPALGPGPGPGRTQTAA